MTTTDGHRSSFPTSPPSAFSQPRRRPMTGHYRPVSQLLSDEAGALGKRPVMFFGRSSAQLSLSNRSLLEIVRKPRRESKESGAQPRRIVTRTSNGKFGKTPVRRSGIGAATTAPPSATITVPKANRNNNVIGWTEDVYVAKKSWHLYGRMKLHPYPNDAVYMQSYDPIMLENEKYDYLLLQRLAPPGPTFNMSTKKPPSSVLDLGCGQGHWILDAARFWPNTYFTGFDLVDVLLPEVHQKANIRLVRGNFVKYSLPFPDKTFDFVRMANLSLAVPRDKWYPVFCEVRRVLKVGGQLELISDELYFPYGLFPDGAPLSERRLLNYRTPHEPRTPRSSEDGEISDASSSTLGDDEDNDPDVTPKGKGANLPRSESVRVANVVSPHCLMAYVQQWRSQYQIARGVEDFFVLMLQKRSIHLTPQDTIPDILKQTFGYKNCGRTQTFDIRLAPPSPSVVGQPGKNATVDLPETNQLLVDPTRNDERRFSGGGRDSITLANPPQHSAKAAGRLGISYSDLVAATATTVAERRQVVSGVRSHRHLATQSPGIIVSPSTFIPLTPIETEFHACKWIHTVLGCKPAIADYVRSCGDENEGEVIEDVELSDALWNYESFRRQRFHWPTDPEPDSESFTSPSISNTGKLDMPQLLDDTDSRSARIRTIRVYHATRTEVSLASRFFSNNAPRY